MLTEREERIVAWLRTKGPIGELRAKQIERGDPFVWRPEPTIPFDKWKDEPSVGR